MRVSQQERLSNTQHLQFYAIGIPRRSAVAVQDLKILPRPEVSSLISQVSHLAMSNQYFPLPFLIAKLVFRLLTKSTATLRQKYRHTLARGYSASRGLLENVLADSELVFVGYHHQPLLPHPAPSYSYTESPKMNYPEHTR
jgi:hypothetical protein